MKIAVLSGKGGTGKTTISSNLVVNIKGATLLDCDVEEPNAHLFFEMENREEKIVNTSYPVVDSELCNLCGKCGDFCNYNAIIPAKKKVLVFEESCHDCGGCAIVCPQNAISYKERKIGKIYSGSCGELKVEYGDLDVGELSGVKIIKEMKSGLKDENIYIIDSPPGTSCATVEAIDEVDFAIIVSEPTPFGVSDMKMVVELLREMRLPFGLVINKAGLGDNEIYEYAEEEKINILLEIPFDKKIAKLYASGEIFSENIVEYKEKFENLFEEIKSSLKGGDKI